MCGRITFTLNKDDFIKILRDNYNIDEYNLEYDFPRYNIAPSSKVLSIINDGEKNRIGLLKWGFVPSWAKDDKFYSINARSETIASKPMFKKAFKTQRCIILADGYYEWKNKVPYLFIINDQKVFSLAGLWSTFIKDDNSKIHTCTIITTTPNELTQEIHDRMPVILTKENEKIWLDPQIKDEELLKSILTPYPGSKMSFYKVSSLVNNPQNDNEDCIKPV